MTEVTEGAAEAVTEVTLAPEAQAPEISTETAENDSGDDAAAPTDDGAPRPKKSAKERIDELTWRLRETERRETELLDRLSRSSREPAAEPEAPRGDGRPDPGQYEYGAADERYIEDLTDWKANTAVERKLSERDQHQEVRTKVQSFAQRLAEQFPEGEPEGIAAYRRIEKISGAIQDVIFTSDIGPKLAEHLGANPAELRRLSALPPHLQGRELGQLEARLSTPAAPQVKTVTTAPEPSPQVRGAGGRFTVAADTNDFAAFEQQYKP